MNIRPDHASAWKGDLLIYAYCETRITLSPELKNEAIKFFNSFKSGVASDPDTFYYENVLKKLVAGEELKNNFKRFFESIDFEKDGMVSLKDLISFFEVMKAIAKDESQIREELEALKNEGKWAGFKDLPWRYNKDASIYLMKRNT